MCVCVTVSVGVFVCLCVSAEMLMPLYQMCTPVYSAMLVCVFVCVCVRGLCERVFSCLQAFHKEVKTLLSFFLRFAPCKSFLHVLVVVVLVA